MKTGKGDKISIPDASEAFHVYGMEWDAKKMDFSVDGKTYFTYHNEGTGEAAWPFDKPQYLILNLAIGGAWGGQKGIDDCIFPQKYVIDYVRVYQKSETPRSEELTGMIKAWCVGSRFSTDQRRGRGGGRGRLRGAAGSPIPGG